MGWETAVSAGHFFRAPNSLIGKVGTKNVAVVLSLIASKCLLLLIYELTAVHVLKSEKVDLIIVCI